jgi:hypothetical protein
MNRPLIQYRATDEFRRAQHSKASGLRVAGAEARQAFDIRMELARKRAKLEEQMLAPMGRLFKEDASSQQALRDLKDLSSATKGQLRDQHKKLRRASRPVIRPAILYGSTSGTVWTGPPFDDTWTDVQGNNLATAEVNGDVNTSYSCSGDIGSGYTAGGILVWVVPESAGDVLFLISNVALGYEWEVKTVAGPTAHTDGYFRILTKAHNNTGGVIDALTQNLSEQIWSAGSSGVDDTQSGQDNFTEQSNVFLQGGAYYEVWFWVENYGDAGSNFWGGWSRSDAQFTMQLQNVGVTEAS